MVLCFCFCLKKKEKVGLDTVKFFQLAFDSTYTGCCGVLAQLISSFFRRLLQTFPSSTEKVYSKNEVNSLISATELLKTPASGGRKLIRSDKPCGPFMSTFLTLRGEPLFVYRVTAHKSLLLSRRFSVRCNFLSCSRHS